jgi:hypothetical protein
MKTNTTDSFIIDALRAQLTDADTPFRKVFVGEDGNLHVSLYDDDGVRHDYCIEAWKVS